MSSSDTLSDIQWRLHLAASPDKVFGPLSTDHGRARFWAESTNELDGHIEFLFPNGMTWRGEILENNAPFIFQINYIGGTITTFELASDGAGGTDLRLSDRGVPSHDYREVLAGWVSVLLSLKGAADFDVDLRNHDPSRTWDNDFVDN